MKNRSVHGTKISFDMCKTGLYHHIKYLMDELQDVKKLYEQYDAPKSNELNENATDEEFLNHILGFSQNEPTEYEKEQFLENVKRTDESYKRLLKKYFTNEKTAE